MCLKLLKVILGNSGDDGGFSLKNNDALIIISLVVLIGTGVEDLVLSLFGSMFSTYVIL